jgi:hypothetical protein
VKWYDSASQSKSQYVFANSIRCRELADKYMRDVDDPTEDLVLDSVEFSSPADSCIAKFHRFTTATAGWQTYHALYRRRFVLNLVSGEKLYGEVCQEEKDCGNGRNVQIAHRADAAYQQAVKGQKIDVSKVK